MKRPHELPLSPEFTDAEAYVESLLSFATSSELFQRLCGGVHILDFLTREPDLYTTILPEEWREWFYRHDISDILDFLMQEDLTQIEHLRSVDGDSSENGQIRIDAKWHGHPVPPSSLIEYVQSIRKLSLKRTIDPTDEGCISNSAAEPDFLSRNVSVGMKPKKKHEVEHFTTYIRNLISKSALMGSENITHLVDFGSGQNYLGRALASIPYNMNVIAIEGRQHNIDGAKSMDVTAKLSKREMVMRNKKEFRKGAAQRSALNHTKPKFGSSENEISLSSKVETKSSNNSIQSNGGIQYVELLIQDGDLSSVTEQMPANSRLMVISLHSCGNLLHHGLRSLVLNPSVKAVSMVGCCYNLVTESLGPPTHKLPNMRSSNIRLDRTSCVCDPHGFPMSERLAKFEHGENTGIRFNITARMMAVQAPQNWTSKDCESFFTRHFYRALLQRMFLDHGLVQRPNTELDVANEDPTSGTGCEPILIGSLRKACYESFNSYVRGALAKLSTQAERGNSISSIINNMTNEEISGYESMYSYKKKELSIIWSLMAFSAGVVESIIVVDRWLYLKEQTEVKHCWVQAVFDYKQSPRNLVIVGIKK